MYTEIIKIIEGALVNDKEKVISYSNLLAHNMELKGEESFAKRIISTLTNKQGTLTSLDSFATRPIDSESRLDMVEITSPQLNCNDVVLDPYSNEVVEKFISSYKKRDLLLRSGIEVSNTLLLYGPPGCGKTTVAQYISSVTNLPLVTARLDGLISSLLGSTAKNIRKIFDYVAKRQCVLFLDEFDVIAKLRDDKNELGELKRVVNSLLQNIDGFNNDSILIAATNHEELLDSAVWRRFTTILNLKRPSLDGIKNYITKLVEGRDNNFLNNEKKLERIVKALEEFSYSDIKTVILNALKTMVLEDRKQLTNCDVLKSIYLIKNHSVESEEDYITFLLNNGVTHKELNTNFNIGLRKIQAVSKLKEKEGE